MKSRKKRKMKKTVEFEARAWNTWQRSRMTENRMLEAMKKTRLNNIDHDEKIKLILPELDLAVSDHRFILSLDYARPDLASGYFISIKAKKRNLMLQSRKLSVDDANEIFEFFRALAMVKQV